MKFKILSIKGNSVRVKSGIVTFEVEVVDDNGALSIKPNAWIEDANDFRLLAGAVKGEYKKYTTSLLGDTTSYENKEREVNISLR